MIQQGGGLLSRYIYIVPRQLNEGGICFPTQVSGACVCDVWDEEPGYWATKSHYYRYVPQSQPGFFESAFFYTSTSSTVVELYMSAIVLFVRFFGHLHACPVIGCPGWLASLVCAQRVARCLTGASLAGMAVGSRVHSRVAAVRRCRSARQSQCYLRIPSPARERVTLSMNEATGTCETSATVASSTHARQAASAPSLFLRPATVSQQSPSSVL